MGNSFDTPQSLLILCIVKISKKNYNDVKKLQNVLVEFGYCHLCGNKVLLYGDFTHDVNGNIIIKNPFDHAINVCGNIVRKNDNIKTKYPFGIKITKMGIKKYKSQKKINDLIYKPILNIK